MSFNIFNLVIWFWLSSDPYLYIQFYGFVLTWGEDINMGLFPQIFKEQSQFKTFCPTVRSQVSVHKRQSTYMQRIVLTLHSYRVGKGIEGRQSVILGFFFFK